MQQRKGVELVDKIDEEAFLGSVIFHGGSMSAPND
jgi:hypothetical protein